MYNSYPMGCAIDIYHQIPTQMHVKKNVPLLCNVFKCAHSSCSFFCKLYKVNF